MLTHAWLKFSLSSGEVEGMVELTFLPSLTFLLLAGVLSLPIPSADFLFPIQNSVGPVNVLSAEELLPPPATVRPRAPVVVVVVVALLMLPFFCGRRQAASPAAVTIP